MLHTRWLVALLTICSVTSAALAQRSTPVQLVHPAGAAGDQFGNAVAVDGDTMIVGAPNDNVGANADQGSAHIYRWTGSGWTFEATLTSTGGATDDNFGFCVALYGDTAIIGAYADDVGANPDQGSAFIFTRSGTTWTQQAQLTAIGGAAFDYFGFSVALYGDTAIVGATSDDVGANANQGSAYVFTRAGTTWTQQAQLIATGGAASDTFGISVALSGDTAIVGALLDDLGANSDQGSAYVFTRAGTTWTQQAQLNATAGAALDNFGISVALSGDTALIGASGDDVGAGTDQGSAYVFTRAGTTWTQQAQLTATSGAAFDNFGSSVALSGNTAIVGAASDDVGANSDQGSAYVFTRSGTTWTQQSQLTATGGAAFDYFGTSVALSGDTAIVGAIYDDVGANADQGSAWTFSRIGSTWIAPDFKAIAADGLADDQFGAAVAISVDTAIVGAPFDRIGINSNQGSAYVFVRSGAGWTQQAKLTSADGAVGDFFGISVALSGDTAIVGAYADDVGINVNQGSAYVFTRSGTTWTQQAQLTTSGGAASDLFGNSVALFGDTAIVGVPLDDVGVNVDQGSAYVFVRSGTAWTQQAQFTSSDGTALDNFGASVALFGDTAVVGAPLKDVGANANQGSAYVFVRSGTAWSQQSQLIVSDGLTDDNFGKSVSLFGDTVIVGAPLDDVGANVDQGSGYVFVRNGTAWSQQAQLVAIGAAVGDNFGISIANFGDTAIVGAHLDNVGAITDQGSAFVFARSGTSWTQLIQFAAADGAPGDKLGTAVALSGDTALVGAPLANVGGNADQGSARFLDVPAADFQNAHNDSLDAPFPTLGAALLPAQSGQQITASEAAWRSITSLDTAGRSLILRSDANLRTTSTAVVTLGGSSSLNVGPGRAVEMFGQLRVSAGASADVSADSFLLGSRGTMTARTGSSLTINAPIASLQAQTKLEQGSSLTFSGAVETIGPVSAALNSSLTSGGTFTNIDTFSITGGTLNTPLFFNRAAASLSGSCSVFGAWANNNGATANIFGSSAVFGSFTNSDGAVTTIRSGTLYVFGNLTNNGTIIGTICSNCFSSPPGMDIEGDLAIGAASSLTLPFVDSLLRVGGDLDCAININTRYDMRLATLHLEGTGSEQTLEVMSEDIGADAAGLDRTLAGHFPIHTLHIGASASLVRLVDAHDNDGLGQSGCEALYVDTLQIDTGSRLINTSCRVYYNTLINNGTIDVPANVIKLGSACPADFNHDGFLTFEDFDAFVAKFEAGSVRADFNADGFLTFEDFDAFVAAFEAGC